MLDFLQEKRHMIIAFSNEEVDSTLVLYKTNIGQAQAEDFSDLTLHLCTRVREREPTYFGPRPPWSPFFNNAFYREDNKIS